MELKVTLLLVFFLVTTIKSDDRIVFPDVENETYIWNRQAASNFPQAQLGFPQAPLPPSVGQWQTQAFASALPERSQHGAAENKIVRTTKSQDEIEKIISSGIRKLTLAINSAVMENNKKSLDNIVFSPVSIANALSLIFLGSNGKTFQEISAIMGLATGVVDIQRKTILVHEKFGEMLQKLENQSGLKFGKHVRFASAIFVQQNYPIRELYKQTAVDLYKSQVLNVDFNLNPGNAQRVINQWVLDRTDGKIKDILGELPAKSTKVIIVSAMHFKAEWEQTFYEYGTKLRPFYPNGRKSGSNVQIQLMATGGAFPYFSDDILQCEILGLPYKGGQTTMYVVMPFNSNTEVLQQLENRLSPEELIRLVDSTKITQAIVGFPKMKIESTIDLKKYLEQLGLKSLFNPHEANLALLSSGLPVPHGATNDRFHQEQKPTPINPEEDLFIFSRSGISNTNLTSANNTLLENRLKTEVENLDSIREQINSYSNSNSYLNPGLYADQIIHKVYMDITETGTEAAAATSVSLSRDGSRKTFRVDVPFFYFILHEETKVIAFWGSVKIPTPNFK